MQKASTKKTMLGTSWGWFFQSGNWLPSKASSKDWKFPFAIFGGRFHHFRVDKIWQLINWRRLWMKTCYSFIQLYTVYFKMKGHNSGIHQNDIVPRYHFLGDDMYPSRSPKNSAGRSPCEGEHELWKWSWGPDLFVIIFIKIYTVHVLYWYCICMCIHAI